MSLIILSPSFEILLSPLISSSSFLPQLISHHSCQLILHNISLYSPRLLNKLFTTSPSHPPSPFINPSTVPFLNSAFATADYTGYIGTDAAFLKNECSAFKKKSQILNCVCSLIYICHYHAKLEREAKIKKTR